MQGLGNVSRGLGELLPGALDASPHVSLSLYDSLENSTTPPYTRMHFATPFVFPLGPVPTK